MRRKVLTRDFVFTLTITKNNKLISSIIPKHNSEAKQTYNNKHNDNNSRFAVPPYQFLHGKNIKAIYFKIVAKFKYDYDFIKYLEKKISFDIKEFSQEEIDKYFTITQLQFNNFIKYNVYSHTVTFPFTTIYKFVDNETQNGLMNYAKENLNTDEFEIFAKTMEEI